MKFLNLLSPGPIPIGYRKINAVYLWNISSMLDCFILTQKLYTK